jgi:hypothetical protein
MNRYNIFLSFFVVAVVAFIFFMVFYLNVVLGIIFHAQEYEDADPLRVVGSVFSPGIIISGIVLFVSSLVYRVLGIVHVARNKTVPDGEKALWVIGFMIMGFITAIAFLVMAKTKKFVE